VGDKMKKVEMELTDGVHEKWLEYKKANGFEHDSGAMHHLLKELRYSENEILNIVQSSIICIVDASKVLSEDEFEKIPYLTHHLCDCSICEEEKCLAHTDSKGTIAVSRKHLTDLLHHDLPVPIGLLDLMHSYLHEVVHNIYPDAPKDIHVPGGLYCSSFVKEKTKEIWCKGMVNVCNIEYPISEPEKKAPKRSKPGRDGK
jgi:hypothetical protein